MEEYDIENVPQLRDLIAAGVMDPEAKGPVVVNANLWDGRTVIGTFNTKVKEIDGEKYMVGDVETTDYMFFNERSLVPFVDKLLSDGESFFTVTGTHDEVCSLEWSIQ